MRKIVISILILCLLGAGGGYFYYDSILNKTGAEGREVLFKISGGQSVGAVAQNLKQQDLIRSELVFKTFLKKTGQETSIQAGEYLLHPGLSIKEITEIITKGQVVSREKKLTLLEGWKIADMAAYLSKENVADGAKYAELSARPVSEWDLRFEKPAFLSAIPPSASLEGFLFPDTYLIFADSDEQDVIRKQLENFGQKLDPELMRGIEASGHSLFEIITMASLIEKEVRSYEDMRIVSGLFWNRIKIGQALESCATLAYILGQDKPQYTLEDTQADSPYNTYRHRGLPPGPISNPGLNAIKAAVYPQDTDYNFFLSRPDTGETVFSRSYEEHLRNKAKYLN